MTLQADTLRAEIRARLASVLPKRLGVAVSGGGDSVALLCLITGIAKEEGTKVLAATVDHGLRPESAAEAASVAELAARLNVPHEILNWGGWDGSGNLQDQARRARYRLLADWADRNGIDAIVLGHTADDQAETVLMRLGRSAGVTGLAAMPAARLQDGVQLLRPMLGITRARLRTFLKFEGIGWVEDPSNQDTRFDRIKAREALAGLAPLGITAETLSRVADNLTQAREALEQFAQESARKVTQVDAGDVLVDVDGLAGLPDEIVRRLIAGIVSWMGRKEYPPRKGAVEQAIASVRNGESGVFGGCVYVPANGKVRFCREFNAVRDETCRPGQCWDGRLIVTGAGPDTARVKALGEDGLRRLPDWRETGRPRAALISTPAVWDGEELLAAPLAGFPNGWRVEPHAEAEEFYASLLSH